MATENVRNTDCDGSELNIRRFDPTTMKPHRIIICIGKRGTGKSVLIRDLLGHLSRCAQLNYGLAMSPTYESAEEFIKIMPPSSVYRECRSDIVEAMVDYQERTAHKSGGHSLRSLYLVLDDCLYDKAVLKSKHIRSMFMNGRHAKLTLMCAAQYLMDLDPSLRSQCDYIFALRENIHANRERLFKNFFGCFSRYEEFAKVFDACTANFECLVIDNTVQSNNIEDCIFWYKANVDRPPCRLCDDAFWELDAKRDQQSVGITNCVPKQARKRAVQRIYKHGQENTKATVEPTTGNLPGVGDGV